MKKINLFYLMFIILMFISFNDSILFGKIILLSIISFLCLQVIYYKENQIFILFIIFSLTYFLYLIPYYYFNVYYAIQYNLITTLNTNKLVLLQSFFTCLFFLFLRVPPKQPIRLNIKSRNENKKIYLICFFVMIYIFFFKLQGKTILVSKYGENSVNNVFLEYYLIFFIIAYRNIKNKKLELLLGIFSLFFSLRLLLYGLRLAALFQLILIFILYFENKIKTFWIILGSISLFLLLSFLSFYRLGASTENLAKMLGVIEKNGVKWLQTNQGDVWMSSSMYLDLVKNGIFDLTARVKSLSGFWASMFVPSKYAFKEAYFRSYAQQFYAQKVGGGGVTAIYLYMWYWYIGIIVFAYFLANAINRVYKHKGSFYGLFLMAIFVRWYPYNILIVFKMGFYLLLIDFLLRSFLNKRR